ncbi:hypothetical protein [Brevundimonas diminuta]|uniref:hypothetical protein n=1 Tax=Brevundimonas diminuta TaxID=293 RepID=UPI003F81C7E6
MTLKRGGPLGPSADMAADQRLHDHPLADVEPKGTTGSTRRGAKAAGPISQREMPTGGQATEQAGADQRRIGFQPKGEARERTVFRRRSDSTLYPTPYVHAVVLRFRRHQACGSTEVVDAR